MRKYIEFRASFSTNIIIVRLMKRYMQWISSLVSQNIGTWESVQNTAKSYANIYARKCVPMG